MIEGNNPHRPEVPPEPTGIRLTGDRKSLAIATLVAAIFLLAALGLAVWLFIQKQNSNANVVQVDPNDTTNVAEVTWVAPEVLPASYGLTDQGTIEAPYAYYVDTSGGCSMSTRVLPANGDMQQAVVKANDSEGITTTVVAEVDPITIANAEGSQRYEFAGLNADQAVNVPGVDFDKQSSALYYKQFGQRVAVVAYTCKLAVFEAQAEALKMLVEQFKVKTE